MLSSRWEILGDAWIKPSKTGSVREAHLSHLDIKTYQNLKFWHFFLYFQAELDAVWRCTKSAQVDPGNELASRAEDGLRMPGVMLRGSFRGTYCVVLCRFVCWTAQSKSCRKFEEPSTLCDNQSRSKQLDMDDFSQVTIHDNPFPMSCP